MARISYIFMVVLLLIVGVLQLGTPLIAVLFAYFALTKLDFTRHKAVAVGIFIVLLLGFFYGFALFVKQALVALPAVVETAIPKVISFAEKHSITLPFYDIDSLKALAMEGVKDQLKYVGNFAKFATKEFVALVIGVVVACSLFLSKKVELGRETAMFRNNLYSLVTDEIVLRFRSFYQSFVMVMGAQIIISTINTLFTTIFVIAVRLPWAGVVIVLTFLCGLLPIIGNVISNTIIVGIAFTVSPKLALVALAFLIVIHKLEYFLNSKIIGDRIKNPVWLTLLALILGERLMGIPGMILAPVILHYVKVETSKIRVDETSPPAGLGEPPTTHIAVGK
ncbi:MAG TPA: AI-2E family transporter [Candidatus Binatia bacterium]|nr:AI-2E family transporter [Candidatus Binatia bacterium]